MAMAMGNGEWRMPMANGERMGWNIIYIYIYALQLHLKPGRQGRQGEEGKAREGEARKGRQGKAREGKTRQGGQVGVWGRLEAEE